MGSACGGAGGVVVIEGEAGIGKSALLVAARTVAEERGMKVLEALGSELEAEYPFGVVRQWFESLLRAR